MPLPRPQLRSLNHTLLRFLVAGRHDRTHRNERRNSGTAWMLGLLSAGRIHLRGGSHDWQAEAPAWWLVPPETPSLMDLVPVGTTTPLLFSLLFEVRLLPGWAHPLDRLRLPRPVPVPPALRREVSDAAAGLAAACPAWRRPDASMGFRLRGTLDRLVLAHLEAGHAAGLYRWDATPRAQTPQATALLRQVDGLERRALRSGFHIRDAARAVGLSRQHFARAYRAAAGCTPTAWLRRVRVRQAVHLALDQPGLTVGELAAAVGYGSPSWFCRQFRQETGRTVAEVRRRGG